MSRRHLKDAIVVSRLENLFSKLPKIDVVTSLFTRPKHDSDCYCSLYSWRQLCIVFAVLRLVVFLFLLAIHLVDDSSASARSALNGSEFMCESLFLDLHVFFYLFTVFFMLKQISGDGFH